MGEAKRRKLQLANAPCLCGASKPAKDCCFDGRYWHKASANLGLHTLPETTSKAGCYMHSLGSCDEKISGEHLISDSVIRLLKGDGDFTVSGLPWLPAGKEKVLSPKNFTANCLCRKHNSALSPLDSAALSFFEAVKSSLEFDGPLQRITSGHDLERWLLKTAKALAVSGNMAQDGERLPGLFVNDDQILTMLDDPLRWPEHTGLYCTMEAGHTTDNHSRFQLYPLITAERIIYGVGVNIVGLQFVLMLDETELARNPQLQKAKFRPGSIVISYPGSVNRILLSWEDGRTHTNELSLQFLKPVTRDG